VLPVTYHLDQDRILVHTTRGSRLDAALKDAVVAFEADQLDPSEHSGWSVAVTGVATELDPGRLAISIDLISGRRCTRERITATLRVRANADNRGRTPNLIYFQRASMFQTVAREHVQGRADRPPSSDPQDEHGQSDDFDVDCVAYFVTGSVA
jgi:hypothetical protein